MIVDRRRTRHAHRPPTDEPLSRREWLMFATLWVVALAVVVVAVVRWA